MVISSQFVGGKCSQQAELSGENINITYKPDGTHIAVGNRVINFYLAIMFPLQQVLVNSSAMYNFGYFQLLMVTCFSVPSG